MAESSAPIPRVADTSIPNGGVVVLARLFFVLIFVLAAFNDFSKPTIAYAAAQGVPLASIAVPLAGVLSIVGAFSILLGYRAKVGAWLIVLFLIPVTVMMHKFWGIADPHVAQDQMINFLKNASMLGGALLITQFGAGPLAVDSRRAR
jgi:putative oxidoreductase